MKSKVEQLTDFVKKKWDISLNPSTFQRVRPGYWQRSSGAWSWTMQFSDGNANDFGSQSSVTEILKNKDRAILFAGYEIVIENETA